MHEWALAEAVLETVGNELKGRKNPRLRSVTLVFGELQSVDSDVFMGGLKILAEKKSIDPEVFQIVPGLATFHCRACDSEWTLEEVPDLEEEEKEAIHFLPEVAHAYLRCPECRSPDFEVLGGRGVSIQSIEIEEDK